MHLTAKHTHDGRAKPVLHARKRGGFLMYDALCKPGCVWVWVQCAGELVCLWAMHPHACGYHSGQRAGRGALSRSVQPTEHQ
jgi:hypothetical protein